MTNEHGNHEGLVYYTSFGSNLAGDRFEKYLKGGTVGTRVYEGARDKSPARKDVPVTLDGGLFFAGVSSVWGSGVAFYDETMEGTVYGRAYLITHEQFEDVVAQENRQEPGHYSFPKLVYGEDTGVVLPGAYGRLAVIGEIDGVPVVSFTAPVTVNEVSTGSYITTPTNTFEVSPTRLMRYTKDALRKKGNPFWTWFQNSPSQDYVDTIARGVAEVHDVPQDEARAYVLSFVA